MPVLRQWAVFDFAYLDGEGDKARDELSGFLARLEVSASRFVERHEARRTRQASAV